MYLPEKYYKLKYRKFQDSDCPLRVDACFKLENGKVHVVEPLDHLLSCISQMLNIHQQNKSDLRSATAWPCFSFSTPQDGEVFFSFFNSFETLENNAK